LKPPTSDEGFEASAECKVKIRVCSGRLTGMALRMQVLLREGIAALSGLSMSMRIALHVGTCMGGIGVQ